MTNNTTQLFRDAIAEALRTADPAVVSGIEFDDQSVLLFNQQIRVTGEVLKDPGSHPSVHHGHIVVQIGEDDSRNIDACLVGIAETEEAGLRQCAYQWMQSVAPCIFSLLHSQPVLNAVHFFESDHPLNIPDYECFVGPMSGRMMPSDDVFARLTQQQLFDYADTLAPPGMLHLAKVTISGDEHQWSRTIEVNGHQATYQESPWNVDIPPMPCVVSLFALYFGDVEKGQHLRQELDRGITAYVAATAASGAPPAVDAFAKESNLSIEVVRKIATFVPMAIVRQVLSEFTYSRDYVVMKKDGTADEPKRLMREVVFARTTALFPELSSQYAGGCKTLLMTSAEMDAINQALHNDSKPEDIVLGPATVFL